MRHHACGLVDGHRGDTARRVKPVRDHTTRMKACLLMMVFGCSLSYAQDTPSEKRWSASTEVITYLVPEDPLDYSLIMSDIDKDWFHLGLRYNYEALRTASTWLGYNFSFGKELSVEITPMVGVLFGQGTGLGPGYLLTLEYGRFELYSEGQWVIDPADSSNNYYYSWSDLLYRPIDGLMVGLATQRTRIYQTDLWLNRGFIVGIETQGVVISTYLFDPDKASRFWVLSLGLELE